MAELPTAIEVTSLAGLLTPGILILAIRGRFKDGTSPPLTEQLLSYGVVSVAYLALVYPLFHNDQGPILPHWLWSVLLYGVVPCLIAAALVLIDQTEVGYKITSWLGLRLSHHTPTAWDYVFSRQVEAKFVLLKLNDGTKYAGKMGGGSFASSNSAERDLYIQEVWDFEKVPWERVEPPRGVLFCGKDISWVEIFERRSLL